MADACPYGSWPSPITSELVVRSARLPNGLRVDGDDVWWSEGRPEEGGRMAVLRRRAGRLRRRGAADGPQRPQPPCTSTAAAPGGCTTACCGSPTGRPAAPPRRAGRRARAAHARARGAAGPALRRRRPAPRRRHAAVRPGGAPRRRPRGHQHDRAARRPRSRHARGGRRGPGLRLRPSLAPRRPGVLLARVGPPRHAVGRHRGSWSTTVGAARSVAGADERESIGQPEWAPDGVALVLRRPHRVLEPVPVDARRRARRAVVDLGHGHRPPAVGVRPVALRLPRRRPGRVRVLRGRARATRRCASPTSAGSRTARPAAHRRSTRCGRAASRAVYIAAGPTTEPHVVAVDVDAGAVDVLVPPRDLGLGRRVVLRARADLVPHRRRRHRARAPLPADQPGGARRPPASGRRCW